MTDRPENPGAVTQRGRSLVGWFVEGVDGLLPCLHDGADRRMRRAMLALLLPGGLTAICAMMVSTALGSGWSSDLLAGGVLALAAACLVATSRTNAQLCVGLGALAILMTGLAFATGGLTVPAIAAWIAATAAGLFVAAFGDLFHTRDRGGDAVLQALAEEAGAMVLHLDQFGTVEKVLRTSDDILTTAVATGEPLLAYLHPRDRVAFLGALSALRAGSALRAEVDLRPVTNAHFEPKLRLRLSRLNTAGQAKPVLAVLDRQHVVAPPATERDRRARTSLLTAFGTELLASDKPALSPVLVQGLRLLSALETGSRSLKPEPIDAEALIGGIVRPMRDEAGKRQLSLECETAFAAPLTIDREAISCLLTTLLATAIHETAQGGVKLACRLDADGLTMTVTDTGNGMRTDRHGRQEPGCGLLIAHSLAELLYGRLNVSSHPGVGTIADLFIPADCAERLAAKTSSLKENIVSLKNARKKNQFQFDTDPQTTDRYTA